MKKLIWISMLLFTFAVNAKNITTESTYVTCQQDDGDQWIEVGLILNDGPGLRALVVAHDDDNGSAKLIVNRQVFKSTQKKSVIYQDSSDTIKLTISKDAQGIVGELSVLQDGAGSFSSKGLRCYERSQISFDNK